MKEPTYYRLEVHAGCEGVVVSAPTERDICIAGERVLRHLFCAALEANCVVEGPDPGSERRVHAYLMDVLSELRSDQRGLTQILWATDRPSR